MVIKEKKRSKKKKKGKEIPTFYTHNKNHSEEMTITGYFQPMACPGGVSSEVSRVVEVSQAQRRGLKQVYLACILT